MTMANKITLLRVILSPVFFLIFFLPTWFSVPPVLIIVLLVCIFAVIELSDLFDGKIARKYNEVSDLGKLLDPFSDSFSRLTYFFCFTVAGFMPSWLFLPVLYRDLVVGFIRQLMAREGLSMPARKSGKIKAWVYAITGIVGTLYYFTVLLDMSERVPYACVVTMYALFGITALTAIWTMLDYASVIASKNKS